MPRRVSSPIFVGRVAERAVLSEALERAASGRPGIVLITGEAGVGKSRLLTEVVSEAASMGFTALAGVCVGVAAGTLPYGPLIDIVGDLGRTGRLAALPASTRAEVDRLVPYIAASRPEGPSPGQGGQGRLFAAVRDALAISSESTPILMTIEDLHWADTSTLDLLTYLVRSMQTERYVVVGTARLETLPRRHPLLGFVAELARVPWLDGSTLRGSMKAKSSSR